MAPDLQHLDTGADAKCNAAIHEETPTPPGEVWSSRFGLSNAMQNLLNNNPVLRVTSTNDVCLDVSHIQKRADSPTLALLGRFSNSLKKAFDVRECVSPLSTRANGAESCASPSLETNAKGIKKRKSRADAAGDAGAAGAAGAADSAGSHKSLFSNFKVITKRPKMSSDIVSCGTGGVAVNSPTTALQPAVQTTEFSGESYNEVARNVECMKVPIGISPLDRITIYDGRAKRLTRMYIEMPRNAYDGMSLPNIQPESHFKQIMIDGDGFQAGGNTQQQHACRLYVHRKLCTNGSCTILGCGFDPAYKIFKDAASDDLKCEYEKHWKTQRKTALRKHGHSLKVKAGSMS